MPKWSGRVFFATSSDWSRTTAGGRYPRLPQTGWKHLPRPGTDVLRKTPVDGLLLMLRYGLIHMPSSQLQVIQAMLRDAADRNRRRWVPIEDAAEMETALKTVEQEWLRRQSLVNDAALVQRWTTPSTLLTPEVWTAEDAQKLEDRWAGFLEEES